MQRTMVRELADLGLQLRLQRLVVNTGTSSKVDAAVAGWLGDGDTEIPRRADGAPGIR